MHTATIWPSAMRSMRCPVTSTSRRLDASTSSPYLSHTTYGNPRQGGSEVASCSGSGRTRAFPQFRRGESEGNDPLGLHPGYPETVMRLLSGKSKIVSRSKTGRVPFQPKPQNSPPDISLRNQGKAVCRSKRLLVLLTAIHSVARAITPVWSIGHRPNLLTEPRSISLRRDSPYRPIFRVLQRLRIFLESAPTFPRAHWLDIARDNSGAPIE